MLWGRRGMILWCTDNHKMSIPPCPTTPNLLLCGKWHFGGIGREEREGYYGWSGAGGLCMEFLSCDWACQVMWKCLQYLFFLLLSHVSLLYAQWASCRTCAAHHQELRNLCDILKFTLLMAAIDLIGFLLWRRFGVVGHVRSCESACSIYFSCSFLMCHYCRLNE